MRVRRGVVLLAALTLLGGTADALPDPPPVPLWTPEQAEEWRRESMLDQKPRVSEPAAEAFVGATWKSVAIVGIIAAAVVVVVIHRGKDTTVIVTEDPTGFLERGERR